MLAVRSYMLYHDADAGPGHSTLTVEVLAPNQNAPHTAAVVLDEEWHRPYSREQAAFPAAWVRQAKFWPAVSRVDNVYGEP